MRNAYKEYESSRREDLENAWHRALDDPDWQYGQSAPDPW
jgi:hypothetical protein